MTVRKTRIGGFFAIVGFVLIIYIVISAFLVFFYDNVAESKALIPIVVVNENWGQVSGNMDMSVEMIRYGGDCVYNEECHPAIKYETKGIFGKLSKLICSKPQDSSCKLKVTCEDCELDPVSSIEFFSREVGAYAGSIEAEVTAQSSIPDESSFIRYEMTPADHSFVFRGSEETVFSFMAIPSIFTSEKEGDPAEEMGYHMQLGTETVEGSTQAVQALDQAGHIKIKIQYEQGSAALHTDRKLSQRLMAVFMALLGSVAGILGGMGALMGFVEKNYEKQEIAREARIKENKIPINRRLTEYYSENLQNKKLEDDQELNSARSSIDQETDIFLMMPSQDI